MNPKKQKAGRLRRLMLGIIGQKLSKALIVFLLHKKIDKSPAAFPADLSRSSDMLFILPKDRVEMVFLLESLFAILGRYKNSNVTFLCPAAHAPYVSGRKRVQVVKYNPDEFLIYGEEFHRLAGELSNRAFDICVLLEKEYTLAHLYFVGLSRAHLRIGWSGGTGYPFLNVRIIPAVRENVTVWERNLEIAKILDADAGTTVRWGVQQTTAEEVTQMLGEYRLKKDLPLICVDLASLERTCGKDWCAELLNALKGSGIRQFYIFGGPEEEHTDFKDAPFPVLPSMSIPRTAALLDRTDVVITGLGALLGLAQISMNRIVPALTGGNAAAYCKKSGNIMPVTFSQAPDGASVKAVVKNVRTLLAAKPAPDNEPAEEGGQG